MISIYVLQCNINQLVPSNDILIKLQIQMLKTYQFKTVRATVIALKLQMSFCQDSR